VLEGLRLEVPFGFPYTDRMKNKKKVQIHRFWIPSHHSVKPSLYRLFVAKADYDRAIKRIAELEKQIKA
jgi:hypothetical protein